MKNVLDMFYEVSKVFDRIRGVYVRGFDDIVAAFKYIEKDGSAQHDVYIITLSNGVEIKISCDQLLDDLGQDPPCRVEYFKTPSRSEYRPFMEVDL